MGGVGLQPCCVWLSHQTELFVCLLWPKSSAVHNRFSHPPILRYRWQPSSEHTCKYHVQLPAMHDCAAVLTAMNRVDGRSRVKGSEFILFVLLVFDLPQTLRVSMFVCCAQQFLASCCFLFSRVRVVTPTTIPKLCAETPTLFALLVIVLQGDCVQCAAQF